MFLLICNVYQPTWGTRILTYGQDYFRTRRNIKILYKNLQSTKRTKKYIVRVKSKIQNNKYKEVNLDNIQRSSYRQKIILRYQKDTKKQRGNPLR